MIADHAQSATARFQVITQMGSGILELKAQIAALTAQLEAERKRADRAEAQVRQLEQQLVNPKREFFTLALPIANPEDRVKADAELAKKINEGWERFDSAYLASPGERTIHYITLIHAVPLPIQTEKATAAASEVSK